MTGRSRAIVAACLVALAALGLAACHSNSSSGPPRAAIVDQLSTSAPNAAFVHDATEKLVRAGYAVDYYSGDQVTVDLFSRLDDLGYDLLVLRVHTARFQGEWRGATYDNPVLFTNEPYSAGQYIAEQWDLQLNPVYVYEGAPRFFGISPNFIKAGSSYKGATVILMGCSGMSTDTLAAAFVAKGADNVIGWNDLVSAGHTDAATLRVLDHLLVDKLPAQEAIAKTNAEVGTDPLYQSYLLAYAR